MAIADSIKVGANGLAAKTPGAREGAPLLLIIMTDASTTCGEPIKVAGEMKQKYPGLIINVVSLTSSKVAEDVATKTGGKIYNYNENIDVSTILRFATGQSAPPQCNPQ